MSTDENKPHLAGQIGRIRTQVEQTGECHVSCEELLVLCDGEGEQSRQLLSVARIGRWEGWEFEFRTDGSVRFWKRGG